MALYSTKYQEIFYFFLMLEQNKRKYFYITSWIEVKWAEFENIWEHKTFLYCRLLQTRDQVSPRNKDPLPVSPPGSFQWTKTLTRQGQLAHTERDIWQSDCSARTLANFHCAAAPSWFLTRQHWLVLASHLPVRSVRIMAAIKIDADWQLCNRLGLSL